VIEKSITKFEIPYNTKYKRLKRSKLQKEREAAAEGLGVTDDADGDVLTYCLGDGLQSAAEVKDWRLANWSKEQESEMEKESYEWIRIDKDFEWICKIEFNPPIYMYVSQLQQDNDVVAQMLVRFSSLVTDCLFANKSKGIGMASDPGSIDDNFDSAYPNTNGRAVFLRG
jgi:transcription initiation factor TFIID subunit 2